MIVKRIPTPQALHRQRQAGFTIVELMIATMVFATILLIITVGILHFTNDYYKGVNGSTTQNTAAQVLNTVSEAIQFSGVAVSSDINHANGIHVVCVGNQEFVFSPGTLLQSAPTSLGNVGLYQFQIPASTPCDATTVTVPHTNGRELLNPTMRLTSFDINDGGGGPGCGSITDVDGTLHDICTVNVSIAYGEADLLCDTTVTDGSAGDCASGAPSADDTRIISLVSNPNANIRCRLQAGSQFCSVASLSTTVERRL